LTQCQKESHSSAKLLVALKNKHKITKSLSTNHFIKPKDTKQLSMRVLACFQQKSLWKALSRAWIKEEESREEWTWRSGEFYKVREGIGGY
jgi:hypothetical protein